MRSGLRRLRAQKTPIPIGDARRYNRGLVFNLGAGKQDRETFLRQYGMSGTLYGIVSLLAEASATPVWRLYKKAPVDGRRRYATGDAGSDQRTEVVQHAAIRLWNCPNEFHSGFEFREATQQHQELTGETFWVIDNEVGFPTAMWYVRPDRMEPIPDPDDYQVGWIYTSATGEQVPLRMDEVILEKRPDPLDPYRGAGPVASIMPNIQQQRYATEYQRNLFLNGADPGGVITVPNRLNEREFDELIDRWRESHRGVARAGHVGVLEDGMQWSPSSHTNRDLEYGELRLANRDELREAWRVHKSMMGTADDVNRANAQTAEEVFVSWQVIPRLNRRRDTLNSKFLPLFGTAGQGLEFDYDDPSPVNAENAAAELASKAAAAAALITAGFDRHDVLEVVGLPDMGTAEIPPAPVADPASSVPAAVEAREQIRITSKKDAAAKAFETAAHDFPPEAMAWMHHASWVGPVDVPLDHINWTPDEMEGPNPGKVDKFVKDIEAGKELSPGILVKTPSGVRLHLADGHHRYLAYARLKKPMRAFIGTVATDRGPWETMYEQQLDREHALANTATLSKSQVNYRKASRGKKRCGTCDMFRAPSGCTLVKGIIRPASVCDRWVAKDAGQEMSALLRRVLTDGYVPVETGRRS